MEMDSGVVCCIFSLNYKLCNRVKVEEVKLSETVRNLKLEVAKHTDVPVKDFAVIFHGKNLSDSDVLESNGVKYGMTLHFLPKPLSHQPPGPQKVERSEVELEHLAFTLKTSMRASTFRNAFQNLLKPSVFENIIASTPGLAEDPVAIACIQDADLLSQLTDIATLHRAVETHPALVEAITYVVANILQPSFDAAASTPFGYSYLIDPSDEEDLDSSSQADLSSVGGPPHMDNAAGTSSFSGITPAQLASALAAVATSSPISSLNTVPFSPITASPMPPPPSASSSDSTAAVPGTSMEQVITNELFSQAIQQAISVSTQNQIQQLRDMGITNDSLSLRALQITGGNVQAALELIFDLQQNERQNM